ncbi:heparinase II/III domain-containing protein [Nonomuraea turcica]|uniref:heparinase II/III domain-containing protein n=1 Tax=Nonomuraea sp. G32 TaxID=3067274 RepID=UPI00273CD646|nr:heparinase II/III family protein [Nonomuraea sp. G32]MDP4508218.1 heparinase II/III family protein [Nonomuraea sp. G32]
MFWRARTTSGRAICLSDRFPVIKVEEVMRGRVTFAGLPPVELGADVDWTANPLGNRSWALNLHTLRWLGGLVAAYERTGESAYLDRARALAEHWIRENPRGGHGISPWAWAEHAVALRAPVLVCLSEHLRTGVLWDSLAEHGEILADPALYRAGHNHGLDQDIGLLVVGCRLGRARWRDLAVRRMTASAELAIDAQGVLHEQAPRYGLYVHRRLGIALRAIRESGAEPPERLVARRTALEAYIAHATQPDGRLVPIGDSPADARADGFPHDGPVVRVFDGGYVFGRTAWDDPRSAYYSIRFGPGRRLHGHEDHLGVTYSARGRRILVEAGFHSYERTGFVEWTRSPEAHNVPVVTGTFRPGTATRLTGSTIGPSRQAFELADEAYGARRTRHVLVNHGPDLMAVRDTVRRGTLRSLWHFDPALEVVSRGDGAVVLGDGDRRVTLLQLPGDGQAVRPGLVCTGYLHTAQAVTVLSPEAAGVLTVIVPGEAKLSASGNVVTVHTPDGPVQLPYSQST